LSSSRRRPPAHIDYTLTWNFEISSSFCREIDSKQIMNEGCRPFLNEKNVSLL